MKTRVWLGQFRGLIKPGLGHCYLRIFFKIRVTQQHWSTLTTSTSKKSESTVIMRAFRVQKSNINSNVFAIDRFNLFLTGSLHDLLSFTLNALIPTRAVIGSCI